jgi:hypothetical protein
VVIEGSLPVCAGRRTQYSYGIGFIFARFFRSVFPIIKSVAPSIGLKAVQTGAQIARDVRKGQSFKKSAKKRLIGAIENTINNSHCKLAPVLSICDEIATRRREVRKRNENALGREEVKAAAR